jgi:hypothetical protein
MDCSVVAPEDATLVVVVVIFGAKYPMCAAKVSEELAR